jgi:hypothetical protein
VIILLVVGAAGGGYLFLNAQASDVTLEMANAQSSQPFAPSIAPAPASSASPSVAPAASPQPPPKGPNGVAIYGGSGSNSVCDKQKLIDFLTTHSAEASAWAGVEGISTAQISDFIRPLTPEILSRDVRVTNHGFSNSRATTYQSVFQAGTAVLVNQYGYPVVRCLCGNPLTPPVSGTRYHYTGQQWPGFNQTTIIIYVAPPGNAPNVPTPVPAGLADGAYTLSQGPDAVACQSTVNGATLTVAGNVATVTTAAGAVFTGAVQRDVNLQAANFHVYIRGTSNGVNYSIDLIGAADGLGGLTGDAVLGGINPGIQSCNFPFTGHGGSLTAPAPTIPATTMSALAGTWDAHETGLVITNTGAGHMDYADLTKCPSCSQASAPRGTVDFVLTTVASGGAAGHVTDSSDPANWAVGAPVKASLTPAIPGPGQFLALIINGTPLTYFCNSTSVGQCGA